MQAQQPIASRFDTAVVVACLFVDQWCFSLRASCKDKLALRFLTPIDESDRHLWWYTPLAKAGDVHNFCTVARKRATPPTPLDNASWPGSALVQNTSAEKHCSFNRLSVKIGNARPWSFALTSLRESASWCQGSTSPNRMRSKLAKPYKAQEKDLGRRQGRQDFRSQPFKNANHINTLTLCYPLFCAQDLWGAGPPRSPWKPLENRSRWKVGFSWESGK